MSKTEMRLRSERPRSGYVIEQGIPVFPMMPDNVGGLRLLDEKGKVVPASIESDGGNAHGRTTWVRVSALVDTEPGVERRFTLASKPEANITAKPIQSDIQQHEIKLKTPFYRLKLTDPGRIQLATEQGDLISGDVKFQLWPDARSIMGAGAGTCRLADFVAEGWSVAEETPSRCLILLRGHASKYKRYTDDPDDVDPNAQFDCELEMICYAFSPVIRMRWRMENCAMWDAYLERYTLLLPLAAGSAVEDGERSEDGKFLRYVRLGTPGGNLGVMARFVDALGVGGGIATERRGDLGGLTLDDVASFSGDGRFEPHRYLAAERDDGAGLDLAIGGVNPPPDGNQTAQNPEVHRLFYLGMGRTFEGALLINCDKSGIEAELDPIYFELEPNYYSQTGCLPENGDPVDFGDFKDQIFASAEWILNNQWRGTLWWGEWWREWDVYRKQGIESTANGNSPLGPLYHYWRTGDSRFIDCAKRSLEFTYDVQLSKRKTGLGPFLQARRFLLDKIEWVHSRYQRIEGAVKAAHFFGDRRTRLKFIESMRSFTNNLTCPSGAPGHDVGGPNGARGQASSDCANFLETLIICWRETGDNCFLEQARKMARWTMREATRLEREGYSNNSNYWRYVLRGTLAALKATGDKRIRDWYIDKARMNMKHDYLSDFDFIIAMNWIIVEAEKISGETWLLDALQERTAYKLSLQRDGGNLTRIMPYPWSKWPTTWDEFYDVKEIVAYVPVLTARRAALKLPDTLEKPSPELP